MSKRARRLGVIAIAAAGMAVGAAGASPAVAAEQGPCYIHGGSEPFGTCVVNTILAKLPPIT